MLKSSGLLPTPLAPPLTLSFPRLNCSIEHVTFACFEGVEKYPVCLHRERLPESYGRGAISANGGAAP
jgi:hypothetical protein